jgi:hypothetical protein
MKSGRQVGVPLRHLNIFVAENLRQRVEIPTTHHVTAGERMAEIVKAEIQNSRVLENPSKSDFHVGKSYDLSFSITTWKDEFRLLWHSPKVESTSTV